MRKSISSNPIAKRLGALLLVLVMLLGMVPTTVFAAPGDIITTVADPQTLTRPDDIYGNDTRNAGKVTVGKSVSTGSVTVPLTSSTDKTLTASNPNNFMVTVSQSAQVMGVTGETSVPVDVVFVLDTSGSMVEGSTDRVTPMVNAANSAIATLLAANEHNRVAVVAFSSDNYGGGTSDGAAASVLSSLAHYDGAAATAHLTRVNSNGDATNNGEYIAGRDVDTITVNQGGPGRPGSPNQTTKTVNAFRNGSNGGTHIQAGIAAGAQLLANATGTTFKVDGSDVTRMPFLVVLSDGVPTYSSTTEEWYNPSQTGSQQGPGNDTYGTYTGNGFLPALTAAYYKGKITEHYYGANSDATNRCYIYTIGVQVGSANLATLTLNPKEEFHANATGNTHDGRFASYWRTYNTGAPVTVSVGNGSNFTFNDVYSGSQTVANNTYYQASKNWVNGQSSTGASLGYAGGIAYNDGYYSASQTAEINGIFDNIVTEISKKAMSVPTMVTTTEDFSGYVTFTDVLGEYMELKDMVGVLAGGTMYQGAGFARRISAYGDASDPNNDPEFDALLREVLQTRLNMSDSMKNDEDFVEECIAKAKESENQAYWNSNTDYDNSLVWWGSTYDVGEEDTNIQNLGYADDDSITYIEKQKAVAGGIPAGADCVVRSYFFYGTAGDTIDNPDHEHLYFVVRVSRSLTAPYQQTVVISAPASLLSMERVLIHEESNGTYTAEVDSELPARVVYEVGLRGDINPYNVKQIVSDSYKNEAVNGEGTKNYVAATDSYNFFTNDWDRSQQQSSHHRAMTKATFDAAADNSFYRYQENETLYVLNGSTYTKYTGATLPNGVYYYAREGYSWGGTAVNGKYTAQPETFYVKVDVEDDNRASIVRAADNSWYIPAGLYTASTLQVNGDDAMKDDLTTAAVNDGNKTNTAATVAHPHRTGNVNNSHYTVLLGNNGLLTMQAKDAKTVEIDRGGVKIEDADGKAVVVGDELTYTIEAVNTTGAATDIVITDQVPAGTVFVSANNGGTISGDTVRWTVNNVAAGATVSVSFVVEVTEAALDSTVVNIENQALVKIGNNPEYTTNTTNNPPEGKKVVPNTGTVQVGSELTYTIHYANDSDVEQTVTITDRIPNGTAYIAGSANPAANYDSAAKKLVWTLPHVQPGVTDTVSFRVTVTAEAVAGNNIQNSAEIKVGPTDPHITTNGTVTERKTGSIQVHKAVSGSTEDKTFTLYLTEATGTLSGSYTVTSSKTPATTTSVTFTDGVGRVEIKADETLKISGLPLDAHIAVSEENPGAGWTPAYTAQTGYVKETEPFDTLRVTNTYAPSPVWFQLHGIKRFVGAKFPANEVVAFQAQACDADGNVYASGHPNYRLNTATAINPSEGTHAVDFSFSGRSFTAENTYYYLISEHVTNASKLPNVEYAANQYLMKLVISDDHGQLKATTTMKTRASDAAAWSAESDFDWRADKVAFANTHYTPAQVTLSGSKQMSGGLALTDNMFSFELLSAGGTAISTAQLVADTTDTTKGGFTFAPLVYDLEDLGGADSAPFTYYLREIDGGLGGVNYDPKVYTVTVTLEKHDDGTLTATPAYALGSDAKSEIVFSNDYSVSAESAKYSPVANKTLTGRALRAGEFRFEVIALNAEATPGTYTIATELVGSVNVPKVVSTGANAAADANTAAAVTFTPIGFTDHGTPGTPKIYHYLLREVTGTERTITYDTTAYVLEIEVMDHSGELKVDRVKYYNATVNAATVTLGAAVSGAEVSRGTDSEIGQISGDKVPFTNHYGSGYNTLTPVLTKYFTDVSGSSVLKNLSGSEFDFEITDTATTTVVSRGTNEASALAGGAKIDFETIVYTSANMGTVKGTPNTKTYVYTIKEIEPANAADIGLAYDSKTITMTVTVTDNGYGAITVGTPAFTDDDGIDGNEQSFTNKYSPAGTSIVIPVDKQLVGKTLSGEQFTFLLEKWDGTQWVTVDTQKNTATASEAAFELNYTVADLESAHRGTDGVMKKTLEYRITEKAGEITGGSDCGVYSYSAEEYKVTVDVIDNGSGKLSTSVKYEKKADGGTYVASAPPVFTNTYTPNPEKLDVNGVLGVGKITKSVAYPDGTLVTDYDRTKFKFYVEDTMGNQLSTGTTAANGTITFAPELTFTEPRDYHYWIVEDMETAIPGISFDQRRWELHVSVKYDAVSGDLTLDRANDVKIYPFHRMVAVEEIEFVNTYEPAAAELTLVADKALTGRDLQAGEFHFRLMDGERIVAEAVNDAPDAGGNAAVKFHVNYTYADIDEHTYTIVEVNDGKGGVTYDTHMYTVTVKVEDDGGQLKAYVNNAVTSTPVVDSGVDFTNTYKAAAIDVPVRAYKNLTGKDLTADAYTFELVDALGQIVTAKNDSHGRISFTVPFDQATEAPVVYTLREKNDAQGGVTYDTAQFKVMISVIDDRNGNLIPTVAYTTADGQPIPLSAPVFRNSYAAASVDVALTAEKELKGRDLKAGEFLFEVYDSTNALISTGGNTAEGEVVFETITFTQTGKYTLRVVEADTGDKEVTYDDSEFTVSVVVTDDGKGRLQAEVTYPDGGVTFVNSWEKLEEAPNTGDSFNTALMMGALAFSAVAVALLVFFHRRKKEDAAE